MKVRNSEYRGSTLPGMKIGFVVTPQWTSAPARVHARVWLPGRWIWRGGGRVWIEAGWGPSVAEAQPQSPPTWVEAQWVWNGQSWVWEQGHWISTAF